MIISQLLKNIYHVNFDRQKDLCESFMRFQEHFESPEFRGKVFSIKEYKKWYRATSPGGIKSGRFTYNQDWTGFNIPSNILNPFYEGRFNPLSKKEKVFLKLFSDKISGPDFYIIGTFGDIQVSALTHEIAHALYFSDPEYREKMQSLIREIPEYDLRRIHDYFDSTGGYHPDVFEDETHAYVAINMDYMEKNHNISSPELWEVHRRMKRIFDRYNVSAQI